MSKIFKKAKNFFAEYGLLAGIFCLVISIPIALLFGPIFIIKSFLGVLNDINEKTKSLFGAEED